MNIKFLIFILIGINLQACKNTSNTTIENSEIIYYNGSIYTVNEGLPWAEAMLIVDGKIAAIGSNEEVQKVATSNAKTIDLEGQFVMPGLHDTHLHFEGFYTSRIMGDKVLRYNGEEKSIEELQLKLKEYAENNPNLKLLFVEQLDAIHFPNLSPNKEFIDEIVSDRPVVMLSNSEHEALLNSKAMELEGITSETPDPTGGEIIRENGEPTGFLKEKAAGKWAWKHFPELSREEHYQGMHETIQYLNSLGVTSAKEQHAKNHWAQGFKDLDDKGLLTMRIGLSWTYNGPLEPSTIENQENTIDNRKIFQTELIGTEYVKLSLDGTLGSTGMVVHPYIQTHDHGLQLYSDEQLIADVVRFDSLGLSITAHCNADGAVRQFLNALTIAKEKQGKLNGRHQVAHAITIDPEDLKRFAELDATAEFSPIFWFPSELVNALTPQIGKERVDHLFPAKSLQDKGGRFVFASDGPLMWQVPLQGLESAVTRKAPSGGDEVLSPDERIDIHSAIKAYTINSAYLMNQDDITGSLEFGKDADFIILDQNILEIQEDKISETNVVAAYLRGIKIFER